MATQFHQKRIELLINGKEAFSRIIKRIRSAKKSIHINMFIWRDDKMGNKIGKELLNSANRGVKVSISKDALGAVFEKAEENKQSFFHKDKKIFLWVKQKIIDCFYYTLGEAKNDRQKNNKLVGLILNNKNITVKNILVEEDHSKYYIFDGETVILGSMNIENKFIDSDVSGTKWNDYLCEINGKRTVERFKSRLSGKVDYNPNLLFDFLVNRKGRVGPRFEIKPEIIRLLSEAREKAYIEMAYFGDKEITDKIIEAAKRGVRVIIILPKRANLQTDFNLKVMGEILRRTQNGVNVYLCKNMIHGKVINVDERFTLLGSANLNKQGMNKLNEIDVLIDWKDSVFTKRLIRNFKKHIDISSKITDPSQIKFNKLKAFLEGLFAG